MTRPDLRSPARIREARWAFAFLAVFGALLFAGLTLAIALVVPLAGREAAHAADYADRWGAEAHAAVAEGRP